MQIKAPNKITSSYLHELQSIYHEIDNRGIRVDVDLVNKAKEIVDKKIEVLCAKISLDWGILVYVGKDNKPDKGKASLNLNSSSGDNSLVRYLTSRGYKVPKITGKNADGEYETKESANELALRKLAAENQFNLVGGDLPLQYILEIREYKTLKERYLDARLYHESHSNYDLYLSNYNVVGTVGGRRSSRVHTFGFGGNAQNFPKHGETAKLFRRALIPRDNKIFLQCDQVSAEDWPVSALADNKRSLEELRAGVDRHTNFAAAIFNLSLTSKTPQEWKDSLERYLGKKTRHASNYGMKAPMMSDSLTKEGKFVSIDTCKALLEAANRVDPNIKGVFHEYVKRELYNSRILRTPFNRERYFLGLRNNNDNNKILNEAYSYIPQSVVGDNTGFAVYELERNPSSVSTVIQEGHDSIIQECELVPVKILEAYERTIEVFNRSTSFYNGNTINIPIEAEIGVDLYKMFKIKEPTLKAVEEALEEVFKYKEKING